MSYGYCACIISTHTQNGGNRTNYLTQKTPDLQVLLNSLGWFLINQQSLDKLHDLVKRQNK